MIIIGSIEILIMLVLPIFHLPEGSLLEACWDAGSLSLLSTPLLVLRSRFYTKILEEQTAGKDYIRLNRASTLIVIVGLTLFAVAGAGAYISNEVVLSQANVSFDRLAYDAQSAVNDELDNFEVGLEGTRGIFLAHDNKVSRRDFEKFASSQNLNKNFSGV